MSIIDQFIKSVPHAPRFLVFEKDTLPVTPQFTQLFNVLLLWVINYINSLLLLLMVRVEHLRSCGELLLSFFFSCEHHSVILRVFVPTQLLLSSISLVQFFKEIMLNLGVLDLFLAVQVDCVVVSHELVPLKKLDRCLVQLNHYDLVQ